MPTSRKKRVNGKVVYIKKSESGEAGRGEMILKTLGLNKEEEEAAKNILSKNDIELLAREQQTLSSFSESEKKEIERYLNRSNLDVKTKNQIAKEIKQVLPQELKSKIKVSLSTKQGFEEPYLSIRTNHNYSTTEDREKYHIPLLRKIFGVLESYNQNYAFDYMVDQKKFNSDGDRYSFKFRGKVTYEMVREYKHSKKIVKNAKAIPYSKIKNSGRKELLTLSAKMDYDTYRNNGEWRDFKKTYSTDNKLRAYVIRKALVSGMPDETQKRTIYSWSLD